MTHSHGDAAAMVARVKRAITAFDEANGANWSLILTPAADAPRGSAAHAEAIEQSWQRVKLAEAELSRAVEVVAGVLHETATTNPAEEAVQASIAARRGRFLADVMAAPKGGVSL